MTKLLYISGIILSVAVLNLASPAEQCPGLTFENIQERIIVDPCGKRLCELPKEQNITVLFKFNPDHEVKTLINSVSATFLGISVPFIGVDGSNACSNIYHAEDNTPAPCPLAAGKEYVYKKNFYVHPAYPVVSSLRVHWSLDDGNRKVICFEMPAKIVNKKKPPCLR